MRRSEAQTTERNSSWRRVSCSSVAAVVVVRGLADVRGVDFGAHGDIARGRRVPEHLRQQPQFAAGDEVSSTEFSTHYFLIERGTAVPAAKPIGIQVNES